MTALDERLAEVVPLHRPAQRPARRGRTAPAPVSPPVPSDLDAELRAALNRLLAESLARSEASAQDALDNLVGALLNMLKPGVDSLSKGDLLALVERTANRLGCPAASPERGHLERVDLLAQTLADYPSPFQAAVNAASVYRQAPSDGNWGALWVAAQDLHDELDVAVGR